MVVPDRHGEVHEVPTQDGEPDAAGCITPEASPRGMETWAWRIPSKSQMHPKLIRRSRRAGGSGEPGCAGRTETGCRSRGRLAELNAAEQVPGDGEEGQDHKNDKSLVDERGLEGRDDVGLFV